MPKFHSFIPMVVAALVGAGLEVSGYENQALAYCLFGLAAVLVVIPAWPWVKKWKPSSSGSLPKSQGDGAKLEIICDSQDYSYVEFGPPTGHGLDEGEWRHYRIKIRNNTNEAIQDLQVQVTDVMPRPNELLGRLPLFLKFKDYPRNVNKVDLGPRGEILVDVASYHDTFMNASLIIEESREGTNSPIEIYSREDEDQGDPFYLITIRPMALNGFGHPTTFRLGVRNKDLFLEEILNNADGTFEILSGLYYEGLEIYNRGFDSNQAKEAWVASLDEWIVRVESLLAERASSSVRHSFRSTTLGWWKRVPNQTQGWESENSGILNKYSAKLNALDELIRFAQL